MTRLEARTLALRAAAKVAFSVSLAGCSATANDVADLTRGADDAEGEAQTALSSHTRRPVRPVATPSCHDAGPAATCGLTTGKALDESSFACCKAHIKSEVPTWAEDADGGFSRVTPSAEEKTCCTAFVAAVEKQWSNVDPDAGPGFLAEVDWSYTTRCCGVLGNPRGVACTPWGPPVPPEMIDLDAWLEVA